MSRRETITYACEKCGKTIAGPNNLNIVTSLSEDAYWSRLHVGIIHHHGMYNDGTREPADLCQSCAVALLEDAAARVKRGERASAGTEGTDQRGWRRTR